MTLLTPQIPVPAQEQPAPRARLRSLRLPLFLLALVTAVTAGLQISQAAANQPSLAEAIVTPVVSSRPVAVPAPLPQAPPPAVVPAVATPAVTPARALVQGAEGLSPKVLAQALDAVECARAKGVQGRGDLLTIIDYSLPSTQPRLWVLDLAHGKVLYHELVAHGSGSGDNYATRFSNVMDSRQTSLGLFLTGGTYEGGNGYSLKLQGLDPGFNDRAEERHIVIHGAWYVSPEHARAHGRIGRSWGCPALPEQDARPVIDTIKGGTFVYSYGPDPSWQRASNSSRSACSATPAPAPIPVLAATVAR